MYIETKDVNFNSNKSEKEKDIDKGTIEESIITVKVRAECT